MPIVFASVFTLLLLSGMLGGIVFATWFFVSEGATNIPALLAIIITANALLWLVGPWFTDLIQRIFYKISRLSLDELGEKNPKCREIIEQVTQKYGFKTPKLYLIKDQNPTAYTYGSGRFNARIVVSEGLFHYLDDDEAAAVIAHELGHITRYDFVVMSVASTLLQCLYVLYRALVRSKSEGSSSSKKGGGKAAIIGMVAYVFYFIGQYIVLYLSRVREYGADEFAIRETGNPNGLSIALMKIAYGIAIETKKPGDKGLIKGTQALGIMNLKNAAQVSSLGESENEENFSLPELPVVSRILAFDFVSLWAAWAELSSTHPLTGKRVRRISALCKKMGQQPLLDFSQVEQDIATHKSTARSAFRRDLLVLIWPWLSVIFAVVCAILQQPLLAWVGVLLFVFTGFYKIRYKFPRIRQGSEETNYLDLMQDFSASPVRGIPASMQGKVVGRGVAGSYFSEDFLLQTPTGIIFSNYQSWLPLLGNLFAAFGKVKKLIKEHVNARISGWFFRSNTQRIDLAGVEPQHATIRKFRSYPVLGSIVLHILLSLALIILATGIQYAVKSGVVEAVIEQQQLEREIKEVLDQLPEEGETQLQANTEEKNAVEESAISNELSESTADAPRPSIPSPASISEPAKNIPDPKLREIILEKLGKSEWIEVSKTDLVSITSLDASFGTIVSMEGLGQLKNLKELKMDSNEITIIPAEIGDLKELKKLSLNWNHIKEIPKEIGQLDQLEEVYMYVNEIESIPAEFYALSNLKTLWMDQNKIVGISEGIGNFTKLKNLKLNENKIVTIPDSLGKLSNLDELDLSINQITEFPLELVNNLQIKKLNIHSNPFSCPNTELLSSKECECWKNYFSLGNCGQRKEIKKREWELSQE